MIDRDWIAARIPHHGDMCLLHAVREWDDQHIVCAAVSHLARENPLRANGRLGIANAIEYAAQAMAVHGALLNGANEAPKAGFLASVRDVRWHRPRLDDIGQPLTIRATRLSGNDVSVLYQFEIHAGELLASGRVSAILDAAALAGKTL
ncbi:3-hydroxylacyl-ACP dehydratase [Paludibacterium purpuratum]|uniref:Putative hotdog family 3-hydroxylacyl-ACP dehydratase n=1 Tax=Paludibacterium purpuratum TaxID=1144873 RepID=A0A4R7B246_9NEIS|nr:3-hydroxylacyl-ACP dehydratase [Paludibacterium purpuratum]TDR77799.1 putative hotdog family 3-hydroxylacyl-ACP dehydratase [Paludibacterium purpuratum]